MKSLVWRLCGLDTLGVDLALQQLVGWAAAGDVVPTSIQASVAPVSGSLNELISGATAEVGPLRTGSQAGRWAPCRRSAGAPGRYR